MCSPEYLVSHTDHTGNAATHDLAVVVKVEECLGQVAAVVRVRRVRPAPLARLARGAQNGGLRTSGTKTFILCNLFS